MGPGMSRETDLPELYTSRYFNEEILSSGEVVPTRISLRSPESLGIELPYPLRHGVPALAPEQKMLGEWAQLSAQMWLKLSAIGIETIARKFMEISEVEDGKPLALLCSEDVRRPTRCHRVVVSLWLEEALQRPVPELVEGGEVLTLEKLHKQTKPMFPSRRVRG